MKALSINEIRNLYWKVETITKKHKKAYLAAEIYYCAHIFIGLSVLLFKFAEIDIFNNPPAWLGVLFPLLTVGKYSTNYISVIATALCFIIVPAIISAMVYFVLSAPLKKRYNLKKNPYKNTQNKSIFDRCDKIKFSEPDLLKILKNRIHSVVWIQVAAFALILVLFVVLGAFEGEIKPEDIGTTAFCSVLAAPSYAVVLYLLRWFEYRLFIPLDKSFNAVYKARIKTPLDAITGSDLHESHVKSEAKKYQDKLEREKREKKRLDAKLAEARYNGWEPPKPEPDLTYKKRLGYDDGVPVDGRGI